MPPRPAAGHSCRTGRLRSPKQLAATLVVGGLLQLLLPPSAAHAQRGLIAPEPGSGRTEKALAQARRHMVSAAHPLASQAGLEILRAGGSATDAAVAVQLALGLVEPQSSGLGGGGFLLHWDARSRRLASWDGRETAPAAATPDRFPSGRSFDEIVASGLSIGVPGVPRLLQAAHRAHGRLPWPRLFEPALKLAEHGFPVSPRLHALLELRGAASFTPAARQYFFDADGRPWPAGHVLTNPAYAATLRAMAANGADAFYGGSIAEAIVAAVAAAPLSNADLTLADLAAYEAKQRPPLCFGYRGRRVCSMGPPSSGGLALAQTLGLLQPFHLGRGPRAADRAAVLHLIAEAQKLAYADRDRYVADPDRITIPAGLVEPGYLATRRALIAPARAMARPAAGEPPSLGRRSMGEDTTTELAGTSHVSIVDAAGNAVAMTTTIEAGFGARVWAAGFLLNNQLTDFSRLPVDKDGRPVANAVGPGKRPRSSMAPTIILDRHGRLAAVLGSPGGSRIILYVTRAVIGLIDWSLDPQAVAAAPNFGSRGAALELEPGPELDRHVPALAAIGHRVERDEMTSGLHIIAVRNGRLLGGADPRREGLAIGD